MRFAEYPRSPDPSPISGLVAEKKKQTATPLSRGSDLEAWLLRFIYPPCRFSEGELIPPPALAKPASHKLMAAQVGRSVSYNEHKPRKSPPTCLAATRENSVHLEFYVGGPSLCEYEKLQCEMSDLQLKYYELLATLVFLEKREMDIYALLYLFCASNAQFNSISRPFVSYRVEPFPETNCCSWKNAQQQATDSALHKLAAHQRFVLLSDSCVPSYDFNSTYNYIMSSPKRLFDRLQLRHHL
ncbi:unnamed protein product [Linum tenue]|uniref:Uncharacterized protein n=1 Tax=Linum tenue TaxID=586396 RepID=A0AAV0K6W5_9ROSI|nr:unnamed protein product [Linum tenue]CAI0539807.1 unnamed protein product [Linum tenue]